MKYKLIHIDTGKEHLCEKVIIDGFDYYVSDEEININDWYYLPRTNNIYQCKEDATELNLERVFGTKKVIATNNPSIDIPKVVDEVDVWINETTSTLKDTHTIKTSKMCLKAGYNKSQQTHPFSEEDVREIFKIAQMQKNYGDYKPYTFEEAMTIWKEQQKKITFKI